MPHLAKWRQNSRPAQAFRLLHLPSLQDNLVAVRQHVAETMQLNERSHSLSCPLRRMCNSKIQYHLTQIPNSFLRQFSVVLISLFTLIPTLPIPVLSLLSMVTNSHSTDSVSVWFVWDRWVGSLSGHTVERQQNTFWDLALAHLSALSQMAVDAVLGLRLPLLRNIQHRIRMV